MGCEVSEPVPPIPTPWASFEYLPDTPSTFEASSSSFNPPAPMPHCLCPGSSAP